MNEMNTAIEESMLRLFKKAVTKKQYSHSTYLPKIKISFLFQRFDSDLHVVDLSQQFLQSLLCTGVLTGGRRGLLARRRADRRLLWRSAGLGSALLGGTLRGGARGGLCGATLLRIGSEHGDRVASSATQATGHGIVRLAIVIALKKGLEPLQDIRINDISEGNIPVIWQDVRVTQEWVDKIHKRKCPRGAW